MGVPVTTWKMFLGISTFNWTLSSWWNKIQSSVLCFTQATLGPGKGNKDKESVFKSLLASPVVSRASSQLPEHPEGCVNLESTASALGFLLPLRKAAKIWKKLSELPRWTEKKQDCFKSRLVLLLTLVLVRGPERGACSKVRYYIN